ncbi:hypothetical protein FisN_13Lh184 [Fistulifera solaris]|uniref:LEM domain-containing protein n=1 Tax=Fistulifera solaris TaxID=1519565 RepID=A0A1Z5KLU7_FISSO|nr:hypothetical protein FisN_13Lh184 [Fistulifera solaris]|eukprot:GAX27256.1 hypothetical protein FisN_13Lh184 [Fistulifera solaris]
MSAILPPNDERIRQFLRQAGVDENSPMDPVSRDALLELLRQEDANETTNLPTNSTETSMILATEQNTNASLLPVATSSSTEERLLHMMQQQTQMILDLHKRMDYLTEHVLQNNNQQQQQQSTSREELNRQIDELFHKVQIYEQNAETTFTTTASPPNAGRSFVSHLYQVLQIFLALRRRLAPNFDAGLIIKVVFILSILFTRLSRRQQSIDDDDWIWHFYRLHLLVVFVVGGFLYQTGMLKVIYIFYVQEKYFHRILWKGESLGDMEQEVNDALERYAQRMQPQGQRLPPRPRNEPNGTDNVEAEDPGWRDTFIGGVIEPAPQIEQDRGMQWLRDVGLFIGSFFLSIFPMWRPEALARPAVMEVNNEADDGNGLPDIAAPADVLEAAEDEDGDDATEEAKTD